MQDAPIREGQTATNPATGEKVVYRGGQWQPVQRSPQTLRVGTPDPNRAATGHATEVRTKTDEAALPYVGPRAKAEADKAQADAAQAEKDRIEAEANAAQARASHLFDNDLLLTNIRRARELVKESGTTGYAAALKVLPATHARRLSALFDTIRSNLAFDRLQKMRDESKTGGAVGSVSDADMRLLGATAGSLDQFQASGDISTVLDDIERKYVNVRSQMAGDPTLVDAYYKQQEHPPAVGVTGQPGVGGGGAGGPSSGPGGMHLVGGPGQLPPDVPTGGEIGLSENGTKAQPSASLVGINTRVRAIIRHGGSAADVRNYLESVRPGLGSGVANIEAVIDYHRKHPDQPIQSYIDEGTNVPLDKKGILGTGLLSEKMMNDAAQSPVGAAAMGAGDTLTMGLLDNMTSNPALARAGMAGVQQKNPYSYFGGQIGGALLPGMGIDAALGKMGIKGLAARLTADAVPSAAYGAGSADEGNRLEGAATGGLLGIVTGGLGRGVGAAVRGTKNAAVQKLSDLGVQMTPGQLMGGVPKRIEDALTSVPVLGDMIRAQRAKGVDTFNQAAFREASPTVTATGQQGVQQLRGAVDGAYRNALDGVSVAPDQQFVTEMQKAMADGHAIPGLGADFGAVVERNLKPIAGASPTLTGEQYQDMLRMLRNRQKAYRTMDSTGSNPMGGAVADAFGNVENALTGLVERQAPGVAPGLRAANAMFAQKEALKNAVLASESQGGRFMPNQLARAAIRGTKKFGGSDAAAMGNRPFNDLTHAGQEVLPSTLPDSGTAYRVMVPGALALAGGGSGYMAGGDMESAGTGALAAGALASPYLARKLLQTVLTAKRPVAVQKIGDAVARYRIPGALALPLLSTEGQ